MLEDQTIGLVALLVAAIGVVATIVAPNLTKFARVWFDILDVVEIEGTESPTDDLKIVIQHRGATVDRRVFIVRAVAENTGSLDIVGAHFANPVEINLPQSLEILSVMASAEDGVNPDVKHTPRTASLKWTLLKPKEKINLVLVVAAEYAGFDSRRVKRETTNVVRLIDVRTGRGFWASKPGLAGAAGGALTFAAIFGAAITYRYLDIDENQLVVQTSAGAEVLYFDREVRACPIAQPPTLFYDCRDVAPGAVETLLRDASVQDVRLGYPKGKLPIVMGLLAFMALFGMVFVRGFASIGRSFENLTIRRRAI